METYNGKQGGIFEGKSHAEGGIKGIVEDTQQAIEVEGKEALLPKETMKEQKELSVQGTPAEIVDQITEITTGTPASDIKVTDDAQPIKVESGQAIINKRTMAIDKQITAQGTPCEIASELNQLGGGVKFTCDNVKNSNRVITKRSYKLGGNISRKNTDVYNLAPSKAKKVFKNFEAFYSDIVNKLKPTVEYYTGDNTNDIRSYYNVLDNELLVDTQFKNILTFIKVKETVVPDVIVYDNSFYRELAKKYSAKISKDYIESPNPNARVLVFKSMRDALYFLYDSEFAEQQKIILNKARSIADEVKEENILGGAGDYQTLNTLAAKHQVGITEVYKQLQKGILHELEHSTNKAIAEETAKDHLVEDIYYYEKLPFVEQLEFEQGGEINVSEINLGSVFYSPLQKAISNSKFEKMPAKHWADKFGNGEEARSIKLKEWLLNERQSTSITKAEIIDYILQNSIKIEVITKQEIKEFTTSDIEDIKVNYDGSGTWVVKIKDIDTIEFPLDKADDKAEAALHAIELVNYDNAQKRSLKPKYDTYQLPGDKDDYTEVLIILDTDKPKEFENDIVLVEQDSYGDWVIHTTDKVKWRMPDATSKEEALKQFDEKLNSGKWLKKKTIANKDVYTSRHWDEANVLLHLRFNTRIDIQGQKVLFIEEIQSDWAQDGRRQGFIHNKGYAITKDLSSTPIEILPSEKEALNRMFEIERETGKKHSVHSLHSGNIITAPFVTDTNDWVKLGLKYALLFAIKGNAQYLSWINGDQQNERYALANAVKSIQYAKSTDGNTIILSVTDIAGNEIKYNTSITLKEIEDYLGKEIAEKIKDGIGTYKAPLQRSLSDIPEILTIEGENLKVGGKGMIDFYDKIVPNVLTALVKKVAGYNPTIETLYIPSEELKLDAIQYDGTQDVSTLPGNYYINEGDWIVLLNGQMVWFDNIPLTKREAIDMYKNIASEADMQIVENTNGMFENKGIKITTQLKRVITNDGIPIFEQGGQIINH